MLGFLRTIARDKHGATAIEYALVAGVISIAAVVAMGILGQSINDFLFEGVAQSLKDATGS